MISLKGLHGINSIHVHFRKLASVSVLFQTLLLFFQVNFTILSLFYCFRLGEFLRAIDSTTLGNRHNLISNLIRSTELRNFIIYNFSCRDNFPGLKLSKAFVNPQESFFISCKLFDVKKYKFHLQLQSTKKHFLFDVQHRWNQTNAITAYHAIGRM